MAESSNGMQESDTGDTTLVSESVTPENPKVENRSLSTDDAVQQEKGKTSKLKPAKEKERTTDENNTLIQETLTPLLTPTLTKRRRTVLSIADKADLIRRMRNGESQRQLAFEYGIGTSTVSDVKKHEAEILRYVEANGDFISMNRRKLEAGAKADVDEAVFEWLRKEYCDGKVLSAADIITRARIEHQRLRGNEEFRASTGWLERFKRRFNIKSFKLGEEDTWRSSSSRTLPDDSLITGRLRRKECQTSDKKSLRHMGKKTGKSHSSEFLEQNFDGVTSPLTRIKAELEVSDEFDYTEGGASEGGGSEYMSSEVINSFHPHVNLEEGHLNLEMPPIEEIPSSGEAAGMLAKALVWAAAQPETSAQELFVLKQLQTKAALKCIIRGSH